LIRGEVQPEAGRPWAEAYKIMYYVYILESLKNGKLYKGFTNDLKRRIEEHKRGKSIFTKNNGPWVLVYYEAFKNKIDAQNEEKFLKSGKGKERIKFLLRDTLH
jgi:putative endonuclease